jgi:protease IV
MFGILSYKAWLIDPSFAAKMAPVLMRAIEHGSIEKFFQLNRTQHDQVISGLYAGIEAEPLNVRGEDLPRYYGVKAKNGLKVAVIPMMGAITKNGDACSWGMRDYQNILAKVANDPTISAVVLHHNNTPGGSHDGTPEMAGILNKFKKATLTFVDGYSASAHYYMASQTDHIMMNKLTPSEVGSIGSLIVYQNVQNMIAKGELPTMEIIRAPQSYNKALFNDLEPLTDGMRAELNADLRDVVKSFITDVKKGRGERLAGIPNDHEMFTGKMYGADDAITNGLADSKGSLLDAINKVAELAIAPKQKSTQAPQGQVNTEMKFPKLSKLFSGEAWNKVLSVFTDDQAQLEATEKVVADMEAELTSVKAEKDALATTASAHEAKVTELTTQVQSLEGQVATLNTEKATLQAALDRKPAGHATTVVADSDPEPDSDQKSKFHTSIDDEVAQYQSAIKSKSK